MNFSSADDFLPTASWEMLRLRARLLRRIREFFDSRGFLEVDTPVLSADVVVDRHLDPFATLLSDDPARPESGRRLWLQTSPEFAMKRLMAAGGESIYQITHAFRQHEAGSRHNPEFTLVEWYRRGDQMADGMDCLSDLAEAVLKRGPAERIAYRDAFLQYVGCDPHTAPTEALRDRTKAAGVSVPASFDPHDRDSWLELLLGELVEPHLQRPTILYDYPASQAALARVRSEQPPVAERFELYVAGIELANGYHELLDAEVLRHRNRENNSRRIADGKPPLPEESRLLAAMDAGMPPCTGVALGFDRLVMLAAGVQNIQQVLPFPIDRA